MELEKIISYFKELSSIPRQSGDEKAASDFLVKFAGELGLWVKQDETYNVIVKKPGTEGRENEEAIILQGHLDMVYVVADGVEHIYEDGIQVKEDEEFIYADGTSLGADNGIAISYAMMLMATKEVSHPPLEFIFTAQEEIGLIGAANLDVSELSGKRIINLDSEEEGTFCSGCAGGVRSAIHIPVVREQRENLERLNVAIKGLKGGHSGMEIHLERGNAIQLIGRILTALKEFDVKIGKVEAPGKSNAISSSASMVIYVEKERMQAVVSKLQKLEAQFQNELSASDYVEIQMEEAGEEDICEVFAAETLETLRGILMLMPQGVMNMSMAVPGLVETSINTGNMEEVDGEIILDSALRSSVETEKNYIREKVQTIADVYGVACEWSGEYPGWQYQEVSPLREKAVKAYKELFGKEPKVEAIHAGLECGYWTAKIPNADLLSMGPSMYDVHSPRERVSKQSIANVWKLIKEILSK